MISFLTSSLVVLLALFILLLSSPTTSSVNTIDKGTTAPSNHAFNIASILQNYPNFVAFSNLLTRTKLDEKINKLSTFTLLALDNSSVAMIQGRKKNEILKMLHNHILLGFYDIEKLRKLGNTSVTTMEHQTTRNRREGFLNVTKMRSGAIVFGSAPLVSKVVKPLFARSNNISALHVSTPIVSPGFGQVINPATPRTSLSISIKKAAPVSDDEAPTTPAPKKKAPTADAPAEGDETAPASDDAPAAPAPKKKTTPAPVESDSPPAEAESPPAPAPKTKKAPAPPTDDEESPPAPTPKKKKAPAPAEEEGGEEEAPAPSPKKKKGKAAPAEEDSEDTTTSSDSPPPLPEEAPLPPEPNDSVRIHWGFYGIVVQLFLLAYFLLAL